MTRYRIPDWLLLGAFCAFFFFWGLGSFGLIGADEPRYAQVAREMLARHDWITPVLSGSPWLEKPPLYYWQATVAYKVFGVSDWAARLPPAVDGFALVFAIYFFLRRFRPGFELEGALMLASSAGIIGYARAASMDLPLTVAFTIAMLGWYAWLESGSRGHLTAFYAFIAIAMLAKGPVAPALAVVIIAVFAATERSAQIIWKTLWLPGILLFCAVGLPWYVMVQLRNPQFFHEFIVEHNLARFGTNLYHHPEPFWYYIPVTFLGWVPAAVFVVAACVWAIRRLRNRDANNLTAFLLIWIGVTIVILFHLAVQAAGIHSARNSRRDIAARRIPEPTEYVQTQSLCHCPARRVVRRFGFRRLGHFLPGAATLRPVEFRDCRPAGDCGDHRRRDVRRAAPLWIRRGAPGYACARGPRGRNHAPPGRAGSGSDPFGATRRRRVAVVRSASLAGRRLLHLTRERIRIAVLPRSAPATLRTWADSQRRASRRRRAKDTSAGILKRNPNRRVTLSGEFPRTKAGVLLCSRHPNAAVVGLAQSLKPGARSGF